MKKSKKKKLKGNEERRKVKMVREECRRNACDKVRRISRRTEKRK